MNRLAKYRAARPLWPFPPTPRDPRPGPYTTPADAIAAHRARRDLVMPRPYRMPDPFPTLCRLNWSRYDYDRYLGLRAVGEAPAQARTLIDALAWADDRETSWYWQPDPDGDPGDCAHCAAQAAGSCPGCRADRRARYPHHTHDFHVATFTDGATGLSVSLGGIDGDDHGYMTLIAAELAADLRDTIEADAARTAHNRAVIDAARAAHIPAVLV